MNTIGLDAHSARFMMAVLNKAGKLRQCVNRPMSAENLIELAPAVRGPKVLVVEEGELAHVCRSLLSVVRVVWMKGEAYREAEVS